MEGDCHCHGAMRLKREETLTQPLCQYEVSITTTCLELCQVFNWEVLNFLRYTQFFTNYMLKYTKRFFIDHASVVILLLFFFVYFFKKKKSALCLF